jgi:FkbM family methyltransferase
MRFNKAIFKRLQEENYSIRFLASRIFPLLGLSKFILIQRNGYILRFFPTALSASLWYQADCRNIDINLIGSKLTTGDVYVDVGSNIGDLALYAHTKVKPTGKVIAIEAHPKTYKYLIENIKINDASIITHQVAIGSMNGEVRISDGLSDDQNFLSDDGSIIVPLITLDEILADINDIKLLKIDIEGNEYDALYGAKKVLQRTKYIMFEVWDQHLKRAGNSWIDIFDLLSDFGFQIYNQDKKKMGKNDTFSICTDLIAINERI